eukprot:GILK01004699.1.p1 GENE.GILK01004699.1~~GILK01004699.1.p1  ORF type:complete len:435 (+),score=56.52 GILK01004699.1:29-1333(+)
MEVDDIVVDDAASSSSDEEIVPMVHGVTEEEDIGAGPIKTKNEIIEAPIAEFPAIIDPDKKIEVIGSVFSLVEKVVVVQALKDSRPLNIDNLLCYGDRVTLGRIDEVFGPVVQPLFTIRYAKNTDIDPEKCKPGEPVYYVPEMASYILPDTIKCKGSDASNLHDEEPAVEEIEFSDDEAEREFKKKAKDAKKQSKGQNRRDPSAATMGSKQQPSIQSDFYTPLERPQFAHTNVSSPTMTPSYPTQTWSQPYPYAQAYPPYQQQHGYPQYPQSYASQYTQPQQYPSPYGVPPPPPPPPQDAVQQQQQQQLQPQAYIMYPDPQMYSLPPTQPSTGYTTPQPRHVDYYAEEEEVETWWEIHKVNVRKCTIVFTMLGVVCAAVGLYMALQCDKHTGCVTGWTVPIILCVVGSCLAVVSICTCYCLKSKYNDVEYDFDD